jgi:hypothetical protein
MPILLGGQVKDEMLWNLSNFKCERQHFVKSFNVNGTCWKLISHNFIKISWNVNWDLTHFDDLTCMFICGVAPILRDIKFSLMNSSWVCHFAPCAILHGLLVLSHETKKMFPCPKPIWIIPSLKTKVGFLPLAYF